MQRTGYNMGAGILYNMRDDDGDGRRFSFLFSTPLTRHSAVGFIIIIIISIIVIVVNIIPLYLFNKLLFVYTAMIKAIKSSRQTNVERYFKYYVIIVICMYK